MTEPSANTRRQQGPHRFQPGRSGNPRGRKPGVRNRSTIIAQNLLDGEAEALTRRVIEMALGGDVQALKVCIERLVPPRKGRPISFELPPLETPADATKALAGLLASVASGEITTDEAEGVAKLISAFTQAIEVEQLEARIRALEEKGDEDA